MKFYSDLASEMIKGFADTNLSGVVSKERNLQNDVSIHEVNVINEVGANKIGKPIGDYVTISAKELATRDLNIQKYVAEVFADELRKLIGKSGIDLNKEFLAMVVGLGNRGMTADALGSKVCDDIIVTRHIYEQIKTHLDSRLKQVCLVAPGVLGITGIETFDVIKGVVDRIKPDVVICIDSLASRKTERISTTIQIANTGIVPGGGLKNARTMLTEETLGIPVIAVGIPLVVYATTIASDAIETLAQNDFVPYRSEQAVQSAIEQTVSSVLGDLVVTPKDIDKIVSDSAFVISSGINLALHNSLSIDEVIEYAH